MARFLSFIRQEIYSMLISYKWLKTLIDFKLNAEELSDLLTNTGLEVEKVHPTDSVKGGLRGLIIGQVVTCTKHPDADRLSLTTVDVGGENTLQIVCGGPNIAAGQKVVVAPVGCQIYPIGKEPFTISKAKIRGAESQGMICAEDEIGLGESHDGVIVLSDDAEIGQAASEYYHVETDYQIEIGLTPNRGDATSHMGVARDIKAVLGNELKMPEIGEHTFSGDNSFKVELPNPEMCPRYSGILLKNVSINESPDWLKSRLQSIDLKPINNVVDVTNFVLHELGQPIHAFDAGKVQNQTIIVRPSVKGEKMTTLDGVDRTLTGNELLITDPSKPLAIAGVFGGLVSGVTDKTTSVFVESAYFNPGTIRKSAKTHGLNTDASFRYERGCDPDITILALKRVVDLLQETAGAEIDSSIIDVYPTQLKPIEIEVDIEWLNEFCGAQIEKEEVITILKRLDFKVSSSSSNTLQVVVPLYRSDVTRATDVAEEVLRIHGYNKVDIPVKLKFTPTISEDRTMLTIQSRIAQFLNGQGFWEIMNNSQTKSQHASSGAVPILNPLSAELAVMRTSLIPGALTAIAYNLNRKNKNLSFYEFGKTYGKNGDNYYEQQQLLLAVTGSSTDQNWVTSEQKADYYFLRGVVDSLASSLGISKKMISKVAKLENTSSSLRNTHDVKQDVWTCSIDMKRLLDAYQKNIFSLKDIPLYPIVVRDLSVVININVSFKDIEQVVENSCGNYFQKIEVFDVYTGERLTDGEKAYAFSIHLYDEQKTMTDEVTDSILTKVVKNLENKVGALIRK
jgi:phenylalanyl-tRNA synthetase beta chain